MKERTSILIDTDPGIGIPGRDIDDAVALLLALASTELDIRGITTVSGNVDSATAARNAEKLLAMAGHQDIPIAKGCSAPLTEEAIQATADDARSASPNGESPWYPEQPPPETSGVDFLIRKAQEAERKITIVAIGPLTNIAVALIKESSLVGNIQRIVMMGGSAGSGNVTPVAEFNVWKDPEAADVVFRSGIPITMVGLDITTRARIYEATIRPWRDAHSPVVRYLYEQTVNWMDYRKNIRGEGDAGCYFHDAMAIALLVDSSLFATKPCRIDVELNGRFTRGMTVVDSDGRFNGEPNAELVTDVNRTGFVALVVSRILRAWA